MAWDIDPAHSSLEFAVRRMVVSTIKGTFRVRRRVGHRPRGHDKVARHGRP